MTSPGGRSAWTAWSCAVEVTVADAGALAPAVAILRALMDEVDRAVSRFRDDSDLSRVNRRPGSLVPVGALTAELVEVALDAAATTRGAVHPVLGAVLDRLGYDRDIEDVKATPAPAHPPRAADVPAWASVRVEPELRLVAVPRGGRLDLGATAKAWTADEAALRIHERLGCAVLVGIGGDLSCAGQAGNGWRIDVSERRGEPGARVDLSFGGLATSSTLGRAWEAANGERRHHLVDPRTGRPALGRWRTATVWAPTALEANIASTWLLIDPDAAVAWADASGFAARLVDQRGLVQTLGGWPTDSHDRQEAS